MLRELVVAIRNDEASHRDVNHHFSDVEREANAGSTLPQRSNQGA
jgi:hypothetical protein